MFDQKKYMREYMARRSEKRREAGLCTVCGEKAEGKSKCEKCLGKDRERQKKRWNSTEDGACRQCRKASATSGTKFCEGCREKQTRWRKKHSAKRREEGQCLSCNAASEKSRCEKCIAKARELNKALRKKRVNNGLCRECGGEAIPSTRSLRGRDRAAYCRDCYLRMMAPTVLGSRRMWRVLLQKLEDCDWRCPYTGEKLVMGDNLSFDHVNPVSRFPEQRHDPANVEPCTWQVNLMKRDLTREEFLGLIEKIHLFKIGGV